MSWLLAADQSPKAWIIRCSCWTFSGIAPPSCANLGNDAPLNDPAMISEGAEHYAAMCAGCHLAPGMEDTEIRAGLNPQPPKLADPWPNNPGEQFWAIKHGIKFTAMPAWGPTHDDKTIWNIVAFLQKIQTLTPQQYAQMTANAGAEHDQHEHHHAE